MTVAAAGVTLAIALVDRSRDVQDEHDESGHEAGRASPLGRHEEKIGDRHDRPQL